MLDYSFKSKIWKYDGPASWYFVTLPKKTSALIRKECGHDEEGWGRLKTLAKVGQSEWNTAIWFDTKAGSYLLPIKAEIREKEKISEGKLLLVSLSFEPGEFRF